MKKGFKLKDGSIWTIISYNVSKEYENVSNSEIPVSAITEVTGVKWEKEWDSTHPYTANFSDCFFETFDANDERIECIVDNVFDLSVE